MKLFDIIVLLRDCMRYVLCGVRPPDPGPFTLGQRVIVKDFSEMHGARGVIIELIPEHEYARVSLQEVEWPVATYLLEAAPDAAR